MRSLALLVVASLFSTLAYAQKWKLSWESGANYTFMSTERTSKDCSPAYGFCQTSNIGPDSYRAKWGGYGQIGISYQLKEKWKLHYGLGVQFQRYQKYAESISGFPSPYILIVESAENQTADSSRVFEQNTPYPPTGESGDTRLWYLRQQAGASYILFPRLSLQLTAWADVLLSSSEYNYFDYDRSGVSFNHVVAGLMAGINFELLPKLSSSLSSSRGLSGTYREASINSLGNSFSNQLQVGLSYTIFSH